MKLHRTLLVDIGLTAVLVFSFIAGQSLWVKHAIAQSGGGNVSGWFWSGNIGWISLNSTNSGAGGGGPYSVNVDTTSFSTGGTEAVTGYAWSENIGWIHFNPTVTPTSTYPSTPNHGVQVNWSTGQITGWARALSHGGGWDGWIKFSSNSGDAVTYSANVAITGPNVGNISGWAWGSDVVGWIALDPNSAGAGGINFNNNNNNITGDSGQARIDIPLQCSPSQVPAGNWSACVIDPGECTPDKFNTQVSGTQTGQCGAGFSGVAVQSCTTLCTAGSAASGSGFPIDIDVTEI